MGSEWLLALGSHWPGDCSWTIGPDRQSLGVEAQQRSGGFVDS